jgi:hypothetical protein
MVAVAPDGNTDHDGGLVGRDRCLRRWVNVTRAYKEAAVVLREKAAVEKRAGGRGMSPCQSIILRGMASRPLPNPHPELVEG